MQYAVITGASSGIGRAIAIELAKRSFALVLVARRKDLLLQLAASLNTKSEIFVADLTKHLECERLTAFLKDLDVSVFVNNAGFGDCTLFTEGALEKEMGMIELNVKALHFFTKFALQKMKNKGGYILNVGSCAGLMPGGPYMATYYATKAYVVSLTSALSTELKNTHSKVHVSVLCPGPVNTEFNRVAHVEFALQGINASYCAKYAIRQMFKGRTVIVPGFLLRMALNFGRFIPRSLYLKIVMQKQRKKLYG